MANQTTYSMTEDGVTKTPGLVPGFANRYPDAFEKIDDTIKNDPLISVFSKQWYYKGLKDSKVSQNIVLHSNLNNLRLHVNGGNMA